MKVSDVKSDAVISLTEDGSWQELRIRSFAALFDKFDKTTITLSTNFTTALVILNSSELLILYCEIEKILRRQGLI